MRFEVLGLVLLGDLLGGDEGIAGEVGAVKVNAVEVNGGDLVVVVAGVVVNAGAEVAAGGIDGDFVFGIVGGAEAAGAAGLVNGVEDVEELADAAEFVGGGDGVEAGEGGFDETGAGGEVAGETVGAEAVAVGLEVKGGGELVGGFGGGKVEVIVEAEGLDGEGRVVGEDTDGVVVDFEAVGDGFNDDGGVGVGDQPMEFGGWELVAEGSVGEVEILEVGFDFGDGAALTKQPRDELELGEVVAAVGDGVIDGVAWEVETSDAEIEGVGLAVKGGDGGHTDDGKVGGERRKVAESEGVVARGDDDFLTVGKFEVEIATKVSVLGFVSDSCAHN